MNVINRQFTHLANSIVISIPKTVESSRVFVRRCFLTHTFWNGRIVEIRPFILCGLGGGFSEGF